MNTFEKIDAEVLDENLGRREGHKKAKYTLDPDKVSSEDVIDGSSNIDNLNPEKIFMLKEEGKIIDSGLQLDKNKEAPNKAEFELDSEDETSNFENNGLHNEEDAVTTEEVDEVISSAKEEVLYKERAVIASKKNNNNFHDIPKESYGHRGKEHKGKFKKGLESIKRLLKIK